MLQLTAVGFKYSTGNNYSGSDSGSDHRRRLPTPTLDYCLEAVSASEHRLELLEPEGLAAAACA